MKKLISKILVASLLFGIIHTAILPSLKIEAANLYDKKVVKTYIPASQIKSNLNMSKAGKALVDPFSIFAAGAVSTKAKTALAGGGYAIAVYGVGTGISTLIKQDINKFQNQLNLIKKNNAKGIVINQTYYVGYVKKGKKGWLPFGPPTSITTY